MDNITKIEILKTDGCTKSDAERHIKNGVLIIELDEIKSNYSQYEKDFLPDAEEEERQKFKDFIFNGTYFCDHSITTYEGIEYFIEYVL